MSMRKWTREKAERLRALAVREGGDVAGARHGISRERVRQVIAAHGLPPVTVEGARPSVRRVTRADVLRAAEKPTWREAVDSLGVGYNVACRLFEREGVERPRGQGNPSLVDDATARAVHARYLAGEFGLGGAAKIMGYAAGRASATHARMRFLRLGLRVLSVKEGNRARDARRKRRA